MGTAYYFNGSNAYVNVGNFGAVSPTSDFTILLAFYPMSGTGGQVIAGQVWGDSLWIRVNCNNYLACIYLGGATNPGYYSTVSRFQQSMWWQLAYTVSGTTLSIYVNSTLEKTADIGSGRRFSTGNPMWIGWTPYGSIAPLFGGLISMVLIYTRALSNSEIQQIYNTPNNPPTNGLVLWYSNPDFTNECCKGIWRDKSGNGNNGQLYNVQMAYY